MKACITIHVESLWSNRAELTVETELDDPRTAANEQVVATMFDVARLLCEEARSESERVSFGQKALNERHRQVDAREARLDEWEKRLGETRRDAAADAHGEARTEQANVREREEMEREVRAQRSD